MSQKRANHSGFTLVEILVVIGIIGILLAILLPSLNKARRAAVVLASPVLYMGSDQAVHLTDPSGRSDLVLAKYGTSSCPVCHAPPVWSPSGKSIGFSKILTTGGTYYASLLEPVTGQIKTWSTSSNNFIGWLDSERYLQSAGPYNPTIVNVASGSETQIDNQQAQFEFIAPAPIHCPGPYIGMYYDVTNRADVIAFFKKGLLPGKRVWSAARGSSNSTTQSQVSPKVDPIGDYVAWTIWQNGRPYVAMKSTNDPSSTAPSLFGTQYPQAYFCDWTEQGELLVNASINNKWKLIILHRNGTFNRDLATDVDPAPGVVASWRKYEHR